MLYLKPFVQNEVFVYLPGGGVLRGKLLSVAEDHLVMRCPEELRGGEKIEIDRFVSKNAVQWVEGNKGQRVD
jgi:hypothetical protein